jgi:hypothetical protein
MVEQLPEMPHRELAQRRLPEAEEAALLSRERNRTLIS